MKVTEEQLDAAQKAGQRAAFNGEFQLMHFMARAIAAAIATLPDPPQQPAPSGDVVREEVYSRICEMTDVDEVTEEWEGEMMEIKNIYDAVIFTSAAHTGRRIVYRNNWDRTAQSA